MGGGYVAVYALFLLILVLPTLIYVLLVSRVKKISILRQVVISSLASLPVPSLLYSSGDGHMIVFAYLLILFIPLIVFSAVFGLMKNGAGVDFKGIRIVIAWILWAIFGVYLGYIHSTDSYFFELPWVISKNYGFDVDRVTTTFFICYNLIAITLVVPLSYEIGKWVKKFRKG